MTTATVNTWVVVDGILTPKVVRPISVSDSFSAVGSGIFGAFKLGTSTTSGYVLTANASGVGSWQAASGVPYVGATGNVNLGTYNLSTMGSGVFNSIGVSGSIQFYDTSAGYLGWKNGLRIVFYSTAGTDTSDNIFVGRAGNLTMTGYGNFLSGYRAGFSLTTGRTNLLMGNLAGYRMTEGLNNFGLGNNTLQYITTGYENVAIGINALAWAESSSTRNVVIGNGAGNYLNGATHRNVLIGAYAAGDQFITITNSIYIGHGAGYGDAQSNTLYIDNVYTRATPRTQALIYGTFDTTVANQQITFNVGTASFGAGNLITTGDMKAATFHVGADAGVDGTFTTVDSKTVTVKKGIITSIV